MKLRDLEYALKVAETLSFSRAAEACNTTQSTLSGQIKKLEEELGVALFERSNRKVMLTPEGETLLEEAQEVLRHAKQLREAAANLRDPLAGPLRIGAFPTLAPYYFPKVAALVKAKLPHIQPYFIEEKSERLIELIGKGTLDAVLLSPPFPQDGLESALLFEEPFYVAVANDHPLAKRKRLRPEELSEHALYLLEEGHCMREQALEVCSMHGLAQETSFRATGLETLRNMVMAGNGITLLPEIALREEEGITAIPFALPMPMRGISLVWRKTSPREALMRQLVALLRVV